MGTNSQRITDWPNYIKTRVIIDNNNCWIWQLNCSVTGYGQAVSMNESQKGVLAHRLSYEVFNGPIQNGKLVLHSCNKPSCVNPKHLRQGTNQDNSDDMIRAGRHVHVKAKDYNNKKRKQTILKRLGYIITPKGKFKDTITAAKAFNIDTSNITRRIKNPNFPNFYREKI